MQKLLFLHRNFISCAETFFGMKETFLPPSIFGMPVCRDYINDAHSGASALYSCMHVYLDYKLSRNYTHEQIRSPQFCSVQSLWNSHSKSVKRGEKMKKEFSADPFAPVHVRSSQFLSNPNSFTQARFEYVLE